MTATNQSFKTYIQDYRKPVVTVVNLQGVIGNIILKKKNIKQSMFTLYFQASKRNRLNLDSQQKLIDKAFAPKRLEAVFLRINSPGGSAVQSDLISSYIQHKANKKKVKVISFVEDMALSGGYWLACTGSQVFSNR